MTFQKLDEMSWVEIENLNKDKTVIFLSIGPVEEHGPHLPLGTDFFAARDIAELAAHYVTQQDDTVHAVVAPAIPVGCSQTTADFPGTISVRGITLVRLVVDICTSLVRHGFRFMVIVNHHLEPVHLKAILTAIQEVSSYHDVSIIETASIIAYSGIHTEETQKGLAMGLDMKREIHADVRETSFVKYRYPHLIKGDVAQLSPVLIDIDDALRKGCSTFKEMGAREGYLGTPSRSTEEYGRLHLEEGARLTADLALKLINGEQLPEINAKMKYVLDSHVTLD
jgi:creatinine amidohydrolase